MRIVVLDDSESYLQIMERSLARLGHQVFTTASWPYLARLIRSARPELLVLDFDMPGLNGAEVGKSIRQFYDMPILYVSGESDELLSRVVREVPGSSYIRKTRSLDRDLQEALQAMDPACCPQKAETVA